LAYVRQLLHLYAYTLGRLTRFHTNKTPSPQKGPFSS
jgi:hypothetical protein